MTTAPAPPYTTLSGRRPDAGVGGVAVKDLRLLPFTLQLDAHSDLCAAASMAAWASTRLQFY